MKVLLHICCGPCAIYPVGLLRQEGFQVRGFFYNPNIYPQSEYEKRLQAARIAAQRLDLAVIFPADNDNRGDFLKQLSVFEEGPRHSFCWEARLRETARVAKQEGIEDWTTTLLSSPYQDIAEIKRLGKKISEGCQLNFLTKNFRRGFAESHKISKEWRLYHQNYCGCIYSLRERKPDQKGGNMDGFANNKRILVIDDEEELALSLQSILKRAGYEAEFAINGRQALEAAQENEFGIIFLDLHIPEKMSGLEILKSLKKLRPQSKICLMTGWPKGVDAHKEEYLAFLDEGAIDKMLRKPFSREDVLAAVNEIFEEIAKNGSIEKPNAP